VCCFSGNDLLVSIQHPGIVSERQNDVAFRSIGVWRVLNTKCFEMSACPTVSCQRTDIHMQRLHLRGPKWVRTTAETFHVKQSCNPLVSHIQINVLDQ